MITLAKVKDSFLENSKMIIKVLQYGAKTSKQTGPFGIDSSPLDDYTAIYADTQNAGESVILGYINKTYISEKGEIRIFSLNDSGEVKAFIHAKKDGNLELNGGDYSGVRFQNLESAINAKDQLINVELSKIAASLSSLGGIYVAGSISTNLTSSESETVKLK